MATGPLITTEERTRLRTLAEKYRSYAELPVMRQRERLWYAHNALTGPRPMVVMEVDTFEGDLLPPLQCTSPLARAIERQLVYGITNHELVDDDKVLTPELVLPMRIHIRLFDMEISTVHAADSQGRQVGHAWEHPIKNLEEDLAKLRPSVFRYDKEGTEAARGAAQEAVGDILPVRMKNDSGQWHLTPCAKIIYLMGMEAMLLEMMDHPDLMKGLFRFILDDIQRYLDWQEQEKLLTLNNGNDYAGAGSYGFTRELPKDKAGEAIRTGDLWGNMNSQETVGISPDMYAEFIYPVYEEMARRFGLVYYGCCEPVHDIWDLCLKNLPHLRKVSISAWCNEERMGESLRGSRVIYSRKPRPNFVGVGKQMDEAAFAEHMRYTLRCAAGCKLEIIFRDIYALEGDRTKPSRAVKIVRGLIDEMWKG